MEIKDNLRTMDEIVQDSQRYEDMFVALPSFNDRKPVAYGGDWIKVRQEAEDKGYKEPVIVYVPDESFLSIKY